MTTRTLPAPDGWPVLDPAALYGIAGDFVRLVEPHTESDPAALLIQFLVAAGNAAGRGTYFLADGSRHHANMFAVIAGKTAKARKGTSWRRIESFMRMADDDWGRRLQSGLSSGEGLISAVRDGAGDDPGVSEKRLLVIEEELARVFKVLGREGNTLSSIIRNAWDGVDLRVMTKVPVSASGAHISIIAHVTQEELAALLSATDAANGVANRFLWACARRTRLLPEGGAVDDSALSALITRLEWARRRCWEAGHIERTAGAKVLWSEEYERHSEEGVGRFGQATSRAESQITRLSLVFALLDGSAVIDTQHHIAAVATWRYCEDSARFLFAGSLGNADANKLIEALQAAPHGMDRTAIHSGLFSGHRKKNQLSELLNSLAARGLARVEMIETAGRTAERWHAVTPKPVSQFNGTRHYR